jgi:ElaB/YqjD/DUF883 family membrane-anchored ribosome-binding protein
MSEQTRVRGNGHASPEELEQEMAATRAEMDETIAALGQRLSPEALFQRAVDQFGGPSEFAGNMGDAVKRNPIPAALAGIGIGWLMLAHRQGWSSGQAHPSEGPGMSERIRQKAAGAVHSGREMLHGAERSREHAMGEASESASESAHEMRERAEEFNARTRARISKASQSAREWSSQARGRSSEAGRRAGGFYREQPLVVGALAIGIGALLGTAMQKRSEPEPLAQGREELTRRASETASEAIERGGEVARTAGHAAAEKASEFSSTQGDKPHT